MARGNIASGSQSVQCSQLLLALLLGFSIGSPEYPARAQAVPTAASQPERAAALLQSGRQRAVAGDYRGAIAAYNRAILLAPNDAEAYFQRGLLRLQLEDELGALSDFDDAVLRDPRHARAYFHRAGAKFDLGNQTEALVDLRQAAQLFQEMGDGESYQRTQALLEHFNSSVAN